MIGLIENTGSQPKKLGSLVELVEMIFKQGGFLQIALKLDYRPQQAAMAASRRRVKAGIGVGWHGLRSGDRAPRPSPQVRRPSVSDTWSGTAPPLPAPRRHVSRPAVTGAGLDPPHSGRGVTGPPAVTHTHGAVS